MQVYVFADWIGLEQPTFVGTLNADKIKGNYVSWNMPRCKLNKITHKIMIT